MTHLPDAIGLRHARFHSPARLRIACLVPSITETLFALGLGDRVVARTGFCIHPEEGVREVPKVGGTKDVNVAKLIATEPTHVIVNIDENRKDTVTLFALLGHIFSVEDAALALARQLADALTQARAVGASRVSESVLYLIWKNPWMTVSRDTYVSAMLATVGWKTLPMQADKRYPEIAADDSVWRNADRVFLSTEPYLFDDGHIAALRDDLQLQQPIELIDGEMTSWYGARAIAGLKYLADLRRRHEQLSAPIPTVQGLIA